MSGLKSKFSFLEGDGWRLMGDSVDDLIDDLRTALVQAGAVTVTVDGLKAGPPPQD